MQILHFFQRLILTIQVLLAAKKTSKHANMAYAGANGTPRYIVLWHTGLVLRASKARKLSSLPTNTLPAQYYEDYGWTVGRIPRTAKRHIGSTYPDDHPAWFFYQKEESASSWLDSVKFFKTLHPLHEIINPTTARYKNIWQDFWSNVIGVVIMLFIAACFVSFIWSSYTKPVTVNQPSMTESSGISIVEADSITTLLKEAAATDSALLVADKDPKVARLLKNYKRANALLDSLGENNISKEYEKARMHSVSCGRAYEKALYAQAMKIVPETWRPYELVKDVWVSFQKGHEVNTLWINSANGIAMASVTISLSERRQLSDYTGCYVVVDYERSNWSNYRVGRICTLDGKQIWPIVPVVKAGK